MPKKLTYEFVKEQFEKENYELLSKEYKGCLQKLSYICPKGHKHSITWNDWKKGNRCLYCSGKKKKTIEFIKSEFAKEGYKLLVTEYINSSQKLEYICPKGHKHSASWSSWQQKHRCPYCVDCAKLNIEFIRSEFEKENYKLLTKQYINAQQKLRYICSEKHEHSISWNGWQQSKRCPYCAGQGKPTIEFIGSEFEKEGYKLLTAEYKNNRQKLCYICPNKHRHSISWHGWRIGQRCQYCVGKISKGEIEVRDFIKSLDIEILANNRDQIFNPNTDKGLELDIFMPMLNKAVEYNGEYWHQDKNKELLKQQLCKLKMIDLLTIWENEWLNENKECRNTIKKFIFNKESM